MMGTLSNAKGHHDLLVDETSCAPLCQHPSCWASNQRQEKGFPLKRERAPSPPEEDLELPTQKVYNMLEDYGEDKRDRFPAKQSGREAHDWCRSSLPALPQSTSRTSSKAHEPVPALTSFSHESLDFNKRSRMKVVEVQEVFDVEDLNRKWDETFITSQFYVWVPNQNKQQAKRKTLDPIKNMSVSKLTNHPHTVPPKDVTGQLVPEELERQREEARVFDDFPVIKKKFTGVNAGISRSALYSRGTSQRSARPHVDAESLKELLDLPRDILLNVLEQMEDNDLASADKVQRVVKQVQPSTDRLTPRSITPDLLKQKKVKLLGSKEKNQRNPDLLMTKPVFQLDSAPPAPERKIEVRTPVHEPVKETADEPIKDKADEPIKEKADEPIKEKTIEPIKEKTIEPINRPESARDLESPQLLKNKKPLPGITASAWSRSDGSARLASISLGLPELPSGLRQTKPFTYKKQQYVDFSLGPVITPPTTDRSSEAGGSDHGTTMRVNLASASTRQDKDIYTRFSRDGTPLTESSQPLHGISPSTSAKLPKTPMATPVTHSSPTKLSFQRDKTGGKSSTRSPPPSRDITMSPVQKMIAPANSPNQSPGASPEPGNRGLVTIPELNDDGSWRHMPLGKMVSFNGEVPPPPPTSLDDHHHHTYTVFLTNPEDISQTHTVSKNNRNSNSNHKRMVESYARAAQSPGSGSSNEEWPNVSEEAYDVNSYPPSPSKKSSTDQLRLSSAERSSKTPASRGRSTVGSRESLSDKSSVVRLILDDNVKAESPGPPPPSPELREKKRLADDKKRQDMISRESQSMAPLYEESETGENSERYDPGVMTTVSQVTPQPRSGKREISVQTFVNVDIQADGNVTKNDEETGRQSTSTSPAGDRTERTVTGGSQKDDEKDSDPQHQGIEDQQVNRAATGMSRETTGLRKDMEPESVSGNIDLEVVNYEAQVVDRHGTIISESENTDLTTAEEEIQQDSELLPGDESLDRSSQGPTKDDPEGAMDDSNKNDKETDSDKPQDLQHQESTGTVDVETPDSSIRNTDEDDRGASSPTDNQQPEVNEESQEPSGPEALSEQPQTGKPARDPEDSSDAERDPGTESAVDVNVPPPVSRTNTAIEMVKSVIENATSNMEDIISNGSPESQPDPEKQ